jgi:hypothetical protein
VETIEVVNNAENRKLLGSKKKSISISDLKDDEKDKWPDLKAPDIDTRKDGFVKCEVK